jgi:hypothetical protein
MTHSTTRAARTSATAVALGLALAAAGCQAPSLDVTPRFVKLDLEGDLAASSGALSGASNWDRLGLDDEPTSFAPRADLHAGPLDLTLDYAAASFSGTGTTDSQLELDGVTIPLGATVESELDLATLRLTSTWDVVPGDLVTLGLGFGIAAIDSRARIEDTLTNNVVDSDEIVPLPYGALRLGFDFGPLELEGLGSVLAIDVGDAEASYIDVDALARWRVLGGDDRISLSIAAGYRFADIEIEYDDGTDTVAIDAQISGPWVGATVTF